METTKIKLSEALTWEELANIYDKDKSQGGRPARTLQMEVVFEWAEEQTDKFKVSKDGRIHKIIT